MSEVPRRSAAFWAWGASVVGAIIAAVLASMIVGALPSSQDNAGEPTPAQIEQPVRSDPSINTPDSAPSPEDSPPVTAVASTPLTLEDSILTERCARPGNTGFPWKASSPSIGGTTHGTGFSCEIGGPPAQGWVTFAVPEGATHLDVNAGQSLDASNTSVVLRFEVVDDITGAALETHEVAFGELAKFHTPVAGVQRISLRVTLLDHTEDLRNSSGDASWGDPTFSHL